MAPAIRRFAVFLILAAAFSTPLVLLRCASGGTAGVAAGTHAALPGAAPGPSASPAPSPVAPAAPSPTPPAPASSPADSQASPSPAPGQPPPIATTAAAPAESGAPRTGAAPHADRIDFTARILPLLQEKCSPCHFPGGRMYDRLPFDKETTIRLLGTRLFTRLREPEDQEILGAFLEQAEQPPR